MSLIKLIRKAVQNGDINQPFSTKDIKKWIEKNRIVKDGGEEYAESSINAILPNSDTNNFPTTNKNIKILKSKVNENGIHEYWF